MTDQRPIRRALISVYDKTGLADLAAGLHEAGIEIVSTGSTAARIAELRNQAGFQIAYRDCYRRWRAGEDVEFPYGTYWLARYARVRVAPPPGGC